MKHFRLLLATIIIIILTGCIGKNSSMSKHHVSKATFLSKTTRKHTANRTSTSLGGLAGTGTGMSIASSLDKIDREHMINITQNALNIGAEGQIMQWRNPETSINIKVKLLSDNLSEGELICRKYKLTINVADNKEQAIGKACRKLEGAWHIAR